MNFLKQTFLILILSALVQTWLPWWALVLPAIAVSFWYGRSAGGSFAAGFVSICLLWVGLSLYIDWSTGSQLSQKIAMLFPGKSMLVLRLIMVVVGGLTGGLASLTGYSLKTMR